jgi:hypothetical protein
VKNKSGTEALRYGINDRSLEAIRIGGACLRRQGRIKRIDKKWGRDCNEKVEKDEM